MPAPSRFDAYSLVRTRTGAFTVRDAAYGETMHPGVGPVAEAEALYVQQIGLVNRLRSHDREFVIWDVGIGAAANSSTVLRAIEAIPAAVRLLSFDNTDEALRFALGHTSQLPHLAGRDAIVRELLQNRRVEFANGSAQRVQWQLFIHDFPELIDSPAALDWPKPHLILFDPFSPAKNPAMWTRSLFLRLRALLDAHRPCVMPTYSRSTLLRVTLLLAGFWVGAGEATGTKEETTIAANTPDQIASPLDRRWLERARRSDSAEPLQEPIYRRSPLTKESWEQLQQHPQFA